MLTKKVLITVEAVLGAAFGCLVVTTPLFARSTEKVLHTFRGGGGWNPDASLIFDASGNLYGTTANGGTCDNGTVFELTPGANGKWAEKVLHSFGAWPDAAVPLANVVLDSSGNLYGMTMVGGAGLCTDEKGNIIGCGAVFELSPGTNGAWTETVLYSFCSASYCADGELPQGGLIFDASGNLYGTTTAGGGIYSTGTVFELVPTANGQWTEEVLYSFSGGKDGSHPYAGLIFDTSGNLYGTTGVGGAYDYGTVFELSPGNGSWTETVLHSFNDDGRDGYYPDAGLIFDTSGNPYGTTSSGGTHDGGAVFQLKPSGKTWREKVLHNFNGKDGTSPQAGLIFDAAGNLYGTTVYGGTYALYGTVFELSPGTSGRWTERVLHSFSNNGKDGEYPYGLTLDGAGNLYGTTFDGGAYGGGIVFEIKP